MNLEAVTGESNPGTTQRKCSWLVYSPLVLSVISWCKPGYRLKGGMHQWCESAALSGRLVQIFAESAERSFVSLWWDWPNLATHHAVDEYSLDEIVQHLSIQPEPSALNQFDFTPARRQTSNA